MNYSQYHPECSPAFNDCHCSCHRVPGVYHCVPCCYPVIECTETQMKAIEEYAKASQEIQPDGYSVDADANITFGKPIC